MLEAIKKYSKQLANFEQNREEEYQLDKYFIPELQKLKQASQLLLMEYVRALAVVSRLSFFINRNEVELPSDGLSRKSFNFLIGKYSPFRILYLRPLVNFFIEIHIHKKLSELSTIFVQTEFLVQNSLSSDDEYVEWLKHVKKQSDKFQETLSSGKIVLNTLKVIFTFIVGLLIAIFGASSLSDLLAKILLLDLSVSPEIVKFAVSSITLLLTVLFYAYFFFDATFAAKRSIFLGIGTELSSNHNIYKFENDIFRLVGRGKSKELPVDFLTRFILFASFIAFLFWIQSQFNSTVGNAPNTIILPCFSILGIMMLFSLITDILIPWRKRYLKENM